MLRPVHLIADLPFIRPEAELLPRPFAPVLIPNVCERDG